VDPKCFRYWIEKWGKEADNAFGGKAPAELRRLRKASARRVKGRNVFKKAVAYLAKEQQYACTLA